MAPNVKVNVGLQRLVKKRTGSIRGSTESSRKSLKLVSDNLKAIIKGIKEATPSVILEAMRPTFEKSQVYVPKDTGALAESGRLEIVGETVTINYGKGGSPIYAAYVHEITSYQHKSPTRSKFLQVALEEDVDAIITRIASNYRTLIS